MRPIWRSFDVIFHISGSRNVEFCFFQDNQSKFSHHASTIGLLARWPNGGDWWPFSSITCLPIYHIIPESILLEWSPWTNFHLLIQSWSATVTVYTKEEKSMSLVYFLFYLSFFILMTWLEMFIFSNYGMFINLFVHYCRRGNKHFNDHFRQIASIHFSPKVGKDASYEGGDGLKRYSIPAKVDILSLMFNDENIFPPLYLYLACKLCFYKKPPRKRHK